ncbi:uridine kinase [Actinocorallia sp. A-T 12471]|uniref:uridine kinase n=1 Tax=Actinocorallia sp. A-T 12471 TaxID=3089813 RepID=UPI0029CDA53F|nr:uridine kinase [Actinocorallia sp. A-T 12471]MDX6740808.1 uridine kinase [Actinocorallia sp. A-T 12471]
MRARPISPDRLVAELCARITAFPRDHRVRVAFDGADAARPGDLADALVAPLRASGRAAARVSARDFLRPASLRLEMGREDPDAFYDDWLDARALDREVLGPLEPGGTGKILPSLWDADRDRATRAPYLDLPEGGVLLLDGPLLLGRWLPFDLTVHLSLSRAALARRTPPEAAWTLPAFDRYRAEVDPVAVADVAVTADDPRHPALVVAAD